MCWIQHQLGDNPWRSLVNLVFEANVSLSDTVACEKWIADWPVLAWQIIAWNFLTLGCTRRLEQIKSQIFFFETLGIFKFLGYSVI